MDPLSALSLAGNIIQFVDFGTRLFAEGQELYKSEAGRLKADEELELVINDLSALVRKIQKAVPPNAPDMSQAISDEDKEQLTTFENICHETVKVAKEILTKLGKLKVEGTKGKRKWQVFHQIILRTWTKDEVDGLLKRLSTLETALEMRIIFSILEKINAQSEQMSACVEVLDQQSQHIASSLLDSNRVFSREITGRIATALGQLFSRLEMHNEEEHRRTREAVAERVAQRSPCQRNQPHPMNKASAPEIVAAVEMLDVSHNEESKIRAKVRAEILTALKYEKMTTRYENVADAHPNTFNWAYEDPRQDQLPWSNFSKWLQTGKGVYWISGKPGSGKSTLMKHIFDDDRTRRYLHQWASNTQRPHPPLCLATFFFWNSGTSEQRSQAGMLRALLFQVLERHPDLIPVVLPATWSKLYSKLQSGHPFVWTESWSLRELIIAFRLLLKQTKVPIKLCLLIDGLDEFEGDHEELVGLFQEFANSDSSNLKACLSSRPWVLFKDSFGDCPMLQLQNLTFHDIESFATDRFYANSAFTKLASRNPNLAKSLLDEVVGKADGVFLWVAIVVKQLLIGVRNLDSIPDLWQRLNTLPRDLEPLYEHLQAQIEPCYSPWASKVFQMFRVVRELGSTPFPKLARNSGQRSASTSTGSLSIWQLYLATDESLDEQTVGAMSKDVMEFECERTAVHLTARCACFLEIIPTIRHQKYQQPGSDSVIQYLHRTARDFLENRHRWPNLVAHTQCTDFDPYVSLLQSCHLDLHWIFRNNSCAHSWQNAASNAMIYASYADQHSMSHRTQIRILDDINNIITSKTGRHAPWYNQLDRELVAKNSPRSFLDFALFLNLSGYVTCQLKQSSLGTHELATEFLRRRVVADRFLTSPITPYQSPEMTRALISLGANVNSRGEDGFSAWERFLNQGFSRFEAPLGPKSEYLQVMKVFLSSGADPRASVFHQGKRIQVRVFVTQLLIPILPKEGTEILADLERILANGCLHSSLGGKGSSEKSKGIRDTNEDFDDSDHLTICDRFNQLSTKKSVQIDPITEDQSPSVGANRFGAAFLPNS